MLQKKLTKQNVLELMQKSIDEIANIWDSYFDSPEFKLWHRNIENNIIKIFSENSHHIKEFNSIDYMPPPVMFAVVGYESPKQDFRGYYRNGLNKAKSILQSIINEIEEHFVEEPVTAASSAESITSIIEMLCRRFPLVTRQLSKRHAGRPTLEIKDEYDVQDLMHSLLILYFDDVRPEEWTPSYAGKSARVDFLLKMEKTVLEMKHSRVGLTEKQLGDELIIDIARYRAAHPDCESLYCFVYDPGAYISNPRGIENDLSKTTDGMPVKVIIVP